MNYAYNGRGEQVRRSGKTNTYTLYDEAGHWLGDYDTNGAALQQAIWLDDLPVGVLAKNSLRYVQPDHLGSPRAVIDPVRDVAIWKWDLKGEAFGNTPPDQDPDKDGTAFVFDMRFPGQRYDSATGFNQNYFRDYEPGAGRYGQSDPIGLAGGINSYAYVEGRAFSGLDPLGAVTVRAYVSRAGGSGNEWRYVLEFKPLSLKDVPGLGGKIRKFGNKLESLVEATKPGAIGPKHPVRDYLECGELDRDLRSDYKRAGYYEGQQLTREQAERVLNAMYLSHPEMRQLYDLPEVMLDGARDVGLKNLINSWFDQAHPGELE